MRQQGISRIAVGLVLIAIFASIAQAQTLTGAVTGNVKDATGAVVPAAEIKLTNQDTGVVRTAVSDQSGNYQFLLVPLGNYVLEASMSGFKTFRRAGILVEADRSLGVPIQMQVGEIKDTVEVIAGTPLLDPVTSTLGSVMEEQKLESLPLYGRNPMGLANLVPTVRGIGYFGGPTLSTWRTSAVSIGGGDYRSNSTLVDGIANEKMTDGGAIVVPSVEGTKEFKVITNAMAAEFGRTAGGIVSIITKSGSNELHGSAFEYLRNDVFNANEFFANKARRAKPTLRWNQFGASMGGPVIKNKLFFFGGYDGYRERRQTQQTLTVATPAQRDGDFSQLKTSAGVPITIYDPLTTVPNPASPGTYIRTALANNKIPSNRIDPVAKAVMSYVPIPNLPGAPNTGAQNYFSTSPTPIDKNHFNMRLDYNLTPSRIVAVRYIFEKINWGFANAFNNIAALDGRTIFIPRHNVSIHYTDALSPTFFIDARGGFSSENEHWTVPAGDFDLTTIGMPASLEKNRQKNKDGFPYFNLGADMADFGRPLAAGNPSATGTGSIAFTKAFQKHSVKFGYEHRVYRRDNWNGASGNYYFTRGFTQGPNPLVASATAGYGIASFLLGYPSSGDVPWYTDETRSLHYNATFIQDDWRVTTALTLNIGLRWEREGAVSDRYNVLSNFDRTMTSPLVVPGMSLKGGLKFPGVDYPSRNISEVSNKNFSPRFGFAYQLHQKMVLRGGYALVWIPTTGTAYPSTGFTLSTTMTTSLDGGLTPKDTLSNPFPAGVLRPTGSSKGALTGIGTAISGVQRDVRRGYAQQWNLTLQYEPHANWLLEAAWIGNKGTRMMRPLSLDVLSKENFALGTQLANPVTNPFYGIITSGPLSGKTTTPAQLLLPYPQFTSVDGFYSYWGNSIYHALAVKIEKRFSQGLSVIASYTKSKMLDDGKTTGGGSPAGSVAVTAVQDWNNLRAERSKSDQDIPQRLSVAVSWDIPYQGGGNPLLKAVFGGWRLNGITTVEAGRPIPLAATVAGGGKRPNVVPGAKAKLDNPTIDKWFNTAAFSQPAPYTWGNVSRTLPDVSSDGLFSIDGSISKTFSITEKYKIQFRAEAFNLTNTPTFDTPGTTFGSANFGVVTATSFLPRPREFQFALRLDF
jgi:hypothetical protein